MTVALAALTGLAAARLMWLLARPTFAQPLLLRDNHRGVPVPTAAGVVLPLALVLVEAGRTLAGGAGIGGPAGASGARLALVVVALGLGLVGLLDDLVGAADARGFRGHLGALSRGQLTTGGAKLLVGVAVALVGVASVSDPSLARLAADAALVALAANLANLLDRAPGRAIKAGLACFVVLAVATGAPGDLVGVAVVVGAAAALLVDDLHERLMLGDAGANVLGGALGLGVVVACGPTTRTAVLAVVAALNGAAEVVSFGRVIEAVAPLRAVDRAGRRPDGPAAPGHRPPGGPGP